MLRRRRKMDSTEEIFLSFFFFFLLGRGKRTVSFVDRCAHEDTSVLNGLFWRKTRNETFPLDGFSPINLPLLPGCGDDRLEYLPDTDVRRYSLAGLQQYDSRQLEESIVELAFPHVCSLKNY